MQSIRRACCGVDGDMGGGSFEKRLVIESEPPVLTYALVFSEYLTRQYNARNPSFQPIFLPSSYVRPQ